MYKVRKDIDFKENVSMPLLKQCLYIAVYKCIICCTKSQSIVLVCTYVSLMMLFTVPFTLPFVSYRKMQTKPVLMPCVELLKQAGMLVSYRGVALCVCV